VLVVLRLVLVLPELGAWLVYWLELVAPRPEQARLLGARVANVRSQPGLVERQRVLELMMVE